MPCLWVDVVLVDGNKVTPCCRVFIVAWVQAELVVLFCLAVKKILLFVRILQTRDREREGRKAELVRWFCLTLKVTTTTVLLYCIPRIESVKASVTPTICISLASVQCA